MITGRLSDALKGELDAKSESKSESESESEQKLDQDQSQSLSTVSLTDQGAEVPDEKAEAKEISQSKFSRQIDEKWTKIQAAKKSREFTALLTKTLRDLKKRNQETKERLAEFDSRGQDSKAEATPLLQPQPDLFSDVLQPKPVLFSDVLQPQPDLFSDATTVSGLIAELKVNALEAQLLVQQMQAALVRAQSPAQQLTRRKTTDAGSGNGQQAVSVSSSSAPQAPQIPAKTKVTKPKAPSSTPLFVGSGFTGFFGIIGALFAVGLLLGSNPVGWTVAAFLGTAALFCASYKLAKSGYKRWQFARALDVGLVKFKAEDQERILSEDADREERALAITSCVPCVSSGVPLARRTQLINFGLVPKKDAQVNPSEAHLGVELESVEPSQVFRATPKGYRVRTLFNEYENKLRIIAGTTTYVVSENSSDLQDTYTKACNIRYKGG